ncbi:hypothetical protein [Bradyrhizobium sp. JYMT SZCCT0428]|uniref:hypothetical protein n=1 Tax=Bradyrhizobium sp. JYMT SZCCT0428 TaxID=2807673 RepID=UPI001BAD627D|nr:hypothetical protein [Bradyrhizobium sp. JYMT SZCCT0428]MBR1150117.1 hypothetical protein [Bradyrhizobium sp. JYMT SZCCT0428]
MSEPVFIRQKTGLVTSDERRRWLECCVDEAHEAGATFLRCSHHPEQPDTLLLEGWQDRPDDQGEPRFQRPEGER